MAIDRFFFRWDSHVPCIKLWMIMYLWGFPSMDVAQHGWFVIDIKWKILVKWMN